MRDCSGGEQVGKRRVLDIALLTPIARLLGITTDTLLSFREELTDEEVCQLVCEADERLQRNGYGEAFAWARGMLEQYLNCDALT